MWCFAIGKYFVLNRINKGILKKKIIIFFRIAILVCREKILNPLTSSRPKITAMSWSSLIQHLKTYFIVSLSSFGQPFSRVLF